MPKKKKSRKGRSNTNVLVNPRLESNKPIMVPFRVLISGPSTSVSSTAPSLNENNVSVLVLGDRVSSIADSFTQWRLHNLEIEGFATNISTGGSDTSVIYGVGFTPTNSNNFAAVTSLLTFIDLPAMDWGNGMHKVKFRVPTSLLRSIPAEWLNVSTTGSDELEYAGTLTYIMQNAVNSASVAWGSTFVISGVIELKGAMDTTLVPLDILNKKIERLIHEYNSRSSSEFTEVKENKFSSPSSTSIVSTSAPGKKFFNFGK